jgi:tellurite resistance protein TehA-like permease
MFTTGQLIFGILFFIAFVIAIAYQYRKDINIRKIHYRGSVWILIAFVGFIGMIAVVKFIFM